MFLMKMVFAKLDSRFGVEITTPNSLPETRYRHAAIWSGYSCSKLTAINCPALGIIVIQFGVEIAAPNGLQGAQVSDIQCSMNVEY